MTDTITRKQLEELEEAAFLDRREYHRMLEEMTGITAVPYTGFTYYDAAGNYVGDSDNHTLMDLLGNCYIEVMGE